MELPLSSAPPCETYRNASSRFRPVTGHVVEQIHLEPGLRHCACHDYPVLDLRSPRLEPILGNARQPGCVFLLHVVQELTVERLIENEMRHPPGSEERDFHILRPGGNRPGQCLSELIAACG